MIMNRSIFKSVKQSKLIRVVSQMNRVKVTKSNAMTKFSNTVSYNTNYNMNTSKRSFSTFNHFPPPEEPSNFLFMMLALSMCYLIVKKR